MYWVGFEFGGLHRQREAMVSMGLKQASYGRVPICHQDSPGSEGSRQKLTLKETFRAIEFITKVIGPLRSHRCLSGLVAGLGTPQFLLIQSQSDIFQPMCPSRGAYCPVPNVPGD